MVGWMFTVKLDLEIIRVCVCVSVCVCVCVRASVSVGVCACVRACVPTPVYANDTPVRAEFFIYDQTQIDWRQHGLPI